MKAVGKGSPAVLIGFGSASPKGDGGEEDTSAGAVAGEALAQAVKSGDGQAVYDAFESMYRACSRSKEDQSGSLDTEEAAE